MKKNILHFIKLTLALFLFLQVGEVSAQNNLTMKTYNGVGKFVNATVLDQVFGTVTIDGNVATTDVSFANTMTDIPTTVAGFGGVQVVIINGFGDSPSITIAQADALIAYVKGGGILIANLEGTQISNGVRALKYLGEALLCNTATLTASAFDQQRTFQVPAYHPGNGALLLNTGATTLNTTSSYAYTTGVPSANIVYASNTTATCANVEALDFVVPAYPGTSNSCGVNGMALFSGEISGILLTGSRIVVDTQSNTNYAQLIYDFLYAPSAMKTRRAWSATSTNKNTTCAPALAPCNAGTTAPALSITTINNNLCTTPYINLNPLVTSATPAGASLVWYNNNTRTGSPVLDPTKVGAAGTYYAFYYDATNDCYGPASAAVTASYTPCKVIVPATVCPTGSVDLATRVTDAAPTGYTYTYHSGTPATTANKLPSSVVTTSGDYYVGTYSTGSTCYSATSRPINVTITDCCATLGAPKVN